MVGLLIATHGEFASGLLHAAELIFGKQEKCKVLGLFHGDDITAYGESIVNGVMELDDGDGVLVFTDLFSASPANQVAKNYPQLRAYRFKAITGVNLPMLLEALGKRIAKEDLDSIAKAVIEAGQNGIKDLINELSKKEKI